MTKRRRQTGFMLIEVLISVLLFSVGVLALVGLQAAMTRAQTEAKIRADASYLATELVGVMWSDVANLAKYDSSSCASYDNCNFWLSKVTQSLPSGNATVTVDTTAGGPNQGDVSIGITWTQPGGSAHQFTLSTTVRTAL